MAKRSDFAQKLLDDLRLRKERMAASPSQRSNQSNHLPIDAYAYTKETYRGSRNTNANEIVSSRRGSSRRQMSVNGTSTRELSNQIIIPYEKGQRLSHVTVASENGGKIRRIDFSIMGFLQQIKRGSDLDRQVVPTTLSLVQINEISKGAQKLNHILRSSSNGLIVDTYSLQFAKELLQGAIDLEKSLGMLVDLQITPQSSHNKNQRITLLEEEEEEDDESMRRKEMQLARQTNRMHNMPITVTNSKEARRIIKVSEKGISSNNSSSSSSSSLEQKNQQARIPNVIAKLMGLDNLPVENNNKVEVELKHVLLKKDSGNTNNKQKLEMTSSSKNTAKMMNKQTGNLMKNQKVGEEPPIFGAHKNFVPKKAAAAAAAATFEKDYAQKSLIRDSQNYVKVMMGTKHDHHPSTGNIQQQQHKGSKVEQVHGRSQVKSSIHVTNKHILTNENKSHNHLGGVQKSYSYILSKNGPREQKQLQVKENEALMMVKSKAGSEITTTPKNSSQKKNPAINQSTMLKKSSSHYSGHDQAARGEAFNDTNEKVKEIINNKWGKISEGRHGIKTLKDEKNVHKLPNNNNKKIKNTIKQTVDRMLFGRNGKGKQHVSSSQEASDGPSSEFNVLNKAKQERFIEPDIAPFNVISPNQPHKEVELPHTISNFGGGEIQIPQKSTNDLHYQGVQSVEINLQDQVVAGAADEGFKIGEVELSKTNGIPKDRVSVMNLKLQEKKISIVSTEKPLTNGENCLKGILVTSQLFINTAEALFRLNIPFSVLHGDREDNQDQGSKLILDCGYEVMKRKGIRQELKVHNCSKISISNVNIRSLNDLVRQLNEDMEKLKFYGRERSTHLDVEDYLPKMLEHDVYDKYPDIDCMWDFGWNDETFAFIDKYDIIRDTEKHILSVLLDEITKDCCMFIKY